MMRCILLLLATALLGSAEPDSVNRPEKVGRFGNPQALRIEGDATFSPDEIRSALARSSSFVLNSHPGSPFDKFLGSISEALVRGYKSNGFPNPRVEVAWIGTDDEVVIQVEEGPRFQAGRVRVTGEEAVREEVIRWWLVDSERDGVKMDFNERSERVFQRFGAEKELSWEAALRIFGDHAAVLQNQAAQGGGFLDLAEDDISAPWSPGGWINFTEAARLMVSSVVQRAYMEEGYQFIEFEVGFVEGKREGTMDLSVKILEESPLSLLGEVVVAGNVINSDDAILQYLGLKKGMELKGAYEVDLRRRLWESGRFSGWKVVSWRPPGEAVIQLSICVAEYWEAPPLGAPLTREQKAVRKLAEWVNAYDGESGELVVSAKIHEEGTGQLDLAVDLDGSLAVMAETWGLHLGVEAVPGGELVVFLQGREGSFHASVPVGDSNLTVYLNLMEGFFPADQTPEEVVGNVAASQFKSASISFGAGFGSSVDRSTTIIGIDPATAFRTTGSQAGADEVRIEGDVVTMRQGEIFLRFNEESGRLISVNINGEEASLNVSIEPDGFERLHRKLQDRATGVPNAMPDDSIWALVAASMGLAKELFDGLEDLGTIEDPDGFLHWLENGIVRTRKWLPLAGALGEALETILGDEDEEREDELIIPVDPKLMAGMNLTAILGAAAYDELARVVEPGTWPDLLLRETLFHLYGNSRYLEETVETLHEDESMGPLGCLLCAELLHRSGHRGARRFIEKAKEESNVEGFAKDWTIVLQGTQKGGGAGWRAAAILAKLRIEDLEVALAGTSPELRREMESVLEVFRGLGGGADAQDLAPAMERFWEAGGGDLVRGLVEKVEGRITPKVNPAVFAMLVNGVPVPRAAVHVDRWVGRPCLEPEFEEEWINQVLLAQQMWKQGATAGKDQVAGVRKMILGSLGGGDEKKGWEKARASGMNEEFLDWSLGVLMTSTYYFQNVVGKEDIVPEDVRAFYERRPDLFGAAMEAHVHRIMIPKVGEGLVPADQVSLAKVIRERINAAPDAEAQAAAFSEEAKKHSMGSEAGNGGSCGWIVPEEWYEEELAAAIALVPGPGLSEVIDDGKFLYVIRISGKRRMTKSKPFEAVADEARKLALMDRATKRLRKQADIVRLALPEEGEVFEEPEPAEDMSEVAGRLADMLMPDEKKTDHHEDRIKGTRDELERVKEQAAEGDGRFLYYLGTYHDRGVGMPRDLEAARNCYEQAAEAGERRAMLRLADIYFTGQGVGRDEGKARDWREAAAKALDGP